MEKKEVKFLGNTIFGESLKAGGMSGRHRLTEKTQILKTLFFFYIYGEKRGKIPRKSNFWCVAGGGIVS